MRGAKEWLTRHRTDGRAYQPSIDQPALAALFDLEAARQRSESFASCARRVERLVKRLRPSDAPAPPA